MNNLLVRMNAIIVRNISKFHGKTLALNDVSFSIPKGCIFGLLGPNGAGKTTLISILITLTKPSRGDADICGFNLLKQPHEIRKRIGVVFQESVIDNDLSALDNLELHAMLYKIPKDVRKERINSLLKLAELSDVKEKSVKTFSGGMKRKVEIIRGLLNRPEVLFLDEPTLGLDPKIRRKIWDYILTINRATGITIFLSTNYMEEAQYLCTHIGILNHGKLVAVREKQRMLNTVREDVVNIELFTNVEKAFSVLKKIFHNTVKTETGISVRLSAAEKRIQKLISILNSHNIRIESLRVIKPNLENVFLKYAGEELK